MNNLFQLKKIPDAQELRLEDWKFNDFSLDRDEMIMAGIRMFNDLGLIRKFRIDYDVSFWYHL